MHRSHARKSKSTPVDSILAALKNTRAFSGQKTCRWGWEVELFCLRFFHERKVEAARDGGDQRSEAHEVNEIPECLIP